MACTENTASENYADFILRFYAFFPFTITESDLGCLDFVSNQFVISHQPLSEVLPISNDHYDYYSIPKLYTLLDTTSLESSGILRTLNQPNLGARGQGVIIGLVDTGIDYLNPLFQTPAGTSRILGLWDQSIEGPGLASENPLEEIHYGTVYNTSQLNEALHSSDPRSIVPSTDDSGHGTLMAAIAGGNEDESQGFSGAAPDCYLGIVKLKQAKRYLRDYYFIPEDATAFQEDDIMLGIKYLLLLARQTALPIVIVLGLGTTMGSHDGTSPLAAYLSYIGTSPGVVTVVAGGNETGFGHHYLGLIASGAEYEDVELRVGPGETGFTLELWAREPELYSVGFLSPTGERIDRIPNTRREERQLTFLLEPTVIYLNYRVAESATGSQLIMMRFQAPTPGIWRIRVYNSLYINGEYHMWLPIRGFISDDTYFLRSNPDTTITEPGNAALPITISAYNHRNNSMYLHSSRGYTRLGIVKPDMAAPGVDIGAPGLPGSSGTSIAAALTAGASANLLSWAITNQNTVSMNNSVAKSFLVRGARRNRNFSYPNREWGYGSLDLYNTFLQLRD